jgi:PAS domain S-box-containing protein
MTMVVPTGRFARAALPVAVGVMSVYLIHAVFGVGGGSFGDLIDGWLLLVPSIAAAAICLARALADRRERKAWLVMSAGLASRAIGDLLFAVMFPHGNPPTPSIPDVFYVAFYPALATALVLLIKPHMRDIRVWLDSLTAGLILMALAVTVAFEPLSRTITGPSAEVGTTLGYAANDLVLLSFVGAVFTMTGFKPGRRWGLLLAGLVLATVADGIFSYQVSAGTFTMGTLLDPLWPASMLLIALSAWAPTPDQARARVGGWRSFAAGAILTVTGLSMLVLDHYAALPAVVIWLVAPALLIRIARTTLTFVDMSRAFRAAQVGAALVEASDDAIFRTDREGVIQSWSRGAAAMFGYQAAAIVGRPIDDLIDTRSAGAIADLRALAANGQPVGATVSGVRAGGDAVELGLTLVPIRDRNGVVAGLSAIGHDITPRRRIEIAERESKAKSEFLSRMSHELRTPLNAVLGFGQLLAMREHPPGAREEIEHILSAGDHLLELINETLEISHIESGRLSLTIEPVTVAPVIDEVVGLMAPLSAARDITVTVDRRSVRGTVAADRQRLKQVLLNLLSNAIKFNRYGGRIDVRGEPCQVGRIAIAVTDTGVGIDAADMPRLFSPFERLRTVEGDPDGSGLGLALSKGLMDAMGGALRAVSEPDMGTTLTLELPAAAAVPQLAVRPRAAALPRIAAGGAREGETYTVLYIEDNRSNRDLMEQIFATCDDLLLVTAGDGATGVELARDEPPDLVLLDLNLPDVDGCEVLDRLRADPATRSIPIIAVSADVTPAQIDALLARGALDYLTKPLDVERLLAAVDDALASAPAR